MKHGAYILSESRVKQFEEEWLDGEKIDLITTTFTEGFHDFVGITWEPGAGTDTKAKSLQRTFGQTDRQMIIAYEFAGENRGNYGPPARGDFDGKYRKFARSLVDLGMGDSLIAPNHEFNLDWGSKSAMDEPENYRDGYARCVREMQSVDGANFTFCYAPARNRLGVAPEAWPVQSKYWPSGESPPVVMPSFYDAGQTYPDDLSSISQSELEKLRDEIWQNKHKPLLDMWNDFATARNTTLGFREWGVGNDAYYNPAGGDNPEFIHRMFDYMRNNNVEFQGYWNAESAGGGSHRIWPESETNLIDSGNAWQNEVLVDIGSETETSTETPTDDGSNTEDSSQPTNLGNYTLPAQGSLDWHIPLNENFASIEEDIKSLNERLEQLE
ncbi:hypothetical protein NDI54_15275 [Haloarcula sp. S1AR25-5A]|uniref:GH26 domain-containing protein n=1 Tax=Haloarcula terrestris TaxID=2950533 RepID=A0AAE4F1R3_9EURY|nr:hypothetical protein [Haloarcula terrestris]MDS0222706.1 hypothetical protein [Haloarcula terrestris]